MTDDARAEAILLLLREVPWPHGPEERAQTLQYLGSVDPKMRPALLDAFAAVRAEERERCARVAEDEFAHATESIRLVGMRIAVKLREGTND